MVRCARCRLLFEAPTPGLLPACPQCGGTSAEMPVIEPAAEPDVWGAEPTQKLAIAKI